MPKLGKIDMKNAITFKIVSRSQYDPLVADEQAPQHVLIEKRSNKKVKEEQIKYGIYFDDDYDYLQHLKNVGDVKNELQEVHYKKTEKKPAKSNIVLPSSVFESDFKEKDGMLNRGALPVGPQVHWDPDVVAAMDEDFDFDDPQNIIDDDFFSQAGGLCKIEKKQLNIYNDDDDDEYEDDDDDKETVTSDTYSNSKAMKLLNKEETQSHFTSYSMTSSVIRRNEGLKLLDERFETLFEKEYGEDTGIGALDCEEIGGNVDINNYPLLEQMLQEVEKSKKNVEIDDLDHGKVIKPLLEEEKEIISIDEEWSKTQNEDRFDCESILSTYSNIYNHPKIISERKDHQLKIDPRTGIPVGVIDKPGLTMKKLRQLDLLNSDMETDNDLKSNFSRTSRVSELSIRPKNESKEERFERKNLFKEYKRERRMEKKANKMAFKLEEIKQNREMVKIRNNLNAIKIV